MSMPRGKSWHSCTQAHQLTSARLPRRVDRLSRPLCLWSVFVHRFIRFSRSHTREILRCVSFSDRRVSLSVMLSGPSRLSPRGRRGFGWRLPCHRRPSAPGEGSGKTPGCCVWAGASTEEGGGKGTQGPRGRTSSLSVPVSAGCTSARGGADGPGGECSNPGREA